MLKFFNRIIAVLLISCLTTDTIMMSIGPNLPSDGMSGRHGGLPLQCAFTSQALAPMPVAGYPNVAIYQAETQKGGYLAGHSISPMIPAFPPVPGVLMGDATRTRSGQAIAEAPSDWTLAFIDLDVMRLFNGELPGKKDDVDAYYRNRIQYLMAKHFSDCVWGFDGGDEIFVFIPGDPKKAEDRIEDLRNLFRNSGVNPDRRMTLSAGLLRRKQVHRGYFSGIDDDKKRFLAARERVSRGLAKAKKKSDAIADYAPPGILEILWKWGKAMWYDHFLPLRLTVYQKKVIRDLFAKNDNDAEIPAPRKDEEGAEGAWDHVEQFHSLDEFRDNLDETFLGLEEGTPVLMGATQALYGGKALEEAIRILISKGREVHGSLAGGKVWNIRDDSYTAFDHIILALRHTVTQEFARETGRLPGAWKGAKIKLVRGPPDTVFFALVPPGPHSPEQLRELLRESEPVRETLQDALKRAQDRLSSNPDEFLHPWQLVRYDAQVSLQAAAKIVLASGKGEASPPHRKGFLNPFKQLDVLRTWLAKGVAEHPGPAIPPSRVVLLGIEENSKTGAVTEAQPTQDQLDEAMRSEMEEAERFRRLLDDRPINRETIFIIPTELQALTRDQAFLPIESMVGWPVGETLQHLIDSSADFRELANLWIDGRPPSFEFVRHGSREPLATTYFLQVRDRIEIHLKGETAAALPPPVSKGSGTIGARVNAPQAASGPTGLDLSNMQTVRSIDADFMAWFFRLQDELPTPFRIAGLARHFVSNAYEALVIRSVLQQEADYQPRMDVSFSFEPSGIGHFRIGDNGIGIAPEVLGGIMEKRYSTLDSGEPHMEAGPFLGIGDGGGLGMLEAYEELRNHRLIAGGTLTITTRDARNRASRKIITFNAGRVEFSPVISLEASDQRQGTLIEVVLQFIEAVQRRVDPFFMQRTWPAGGPILKDEPSPLVPPATSIGGRAPQDRLENRAA